jgi:hypothetical protein
VAGFYEHSSETSRSVKVEDSLTGWAVIGFSGKILLSVISLWNNGEFYINKKFWEELISYFPWYGARVSVVRWGTMLQAWMLRVRIPMRSLDFFSWPNPSRRAMALGSTQPLTEMSSRNLPGGKRRPALNADNLTAICEPIVWKMWEPRRLTSLWAFTACYRDSFLDTICTAYKMMRLNFKEFCIVLLLPVFSLHR